MSSQFSEYIFIILGAVTIFMGVQILITGKLPGREEEKVSGFTDKAAKTYKLTSAFLNIGAGILIIVTGILRILNMIDKNLFKIICLAVIAVFIVVYVIVLNKCKKDT